jgi:CheY-like chemotaxis protein
VELEEIDYDLDDVIEAVVQLNQTRATAKNLKLETRLSPKLPRKLHGDPARLQQVLNNLVSNATKFSDEGSIVIAVELTKSEGGGRVLCFSVSDEGPGIPKEAQERIFDAFAQADASTTRRYGGTGLGLAICRQLVELMGGTITVQSQVGKGSTFTFSAPYQAREQYAEPSEKSVEYEESADSTLLSLRVLLAEDNRINRIVAVNQLQKLGCTVDAVEDGRAAVDAALEKPYDIIFMDCHMPLLDGYGATREIRERWTREEPARIIALTANAMQGERERCLACGMDEYLSKPVTLPELRRAMIAVLPEETVKYAVQAPEAVNADRGAVLESLRAMEADGVDVSLVLELFREEAAQAVARVETALAEGDAANLWRAAHKLKGTAAELGAEGLREYWGQLEQCGRSGDLAKSAELFQAARQELDQIRGVLDSAPFGTAAPLAV